MVSADWTSPDQLAISMSDYSIRIFSFNFHFESISSHPKYSLKNTNFKETILNILSKLADDSKCEVLDQFYQFGNESAIKFALLLSASISHKWDKVDSWFLGGIGTPQTERISSSLNSKLNRLGMVETIITL